MISSFIIFSDLWGAYALMNLLAALACTLAFLHIYVRSRFLFLRPSLLLGALVNIFFQWPLAAYASYYEIWLPKPLELSLLVHAPVVAALACAAFGSVETLKATWARLAPLAPLPHKIAFGVMAFMAALIVVFAGAYFAYVPFRCTGLYALFTDFANIATFREMSLKGLYDAVPRYSFSLMASAVIPVFCMFCTIQGREAWRSRNWRVAWLCVALLGAVTPLVFLSGAKGFLVNLFLQIALVFVWRMRLPLNLKSLLSVTLFPLIPAFIFSVFLAFATPSPIAQSVSAINNCVAGIRLTSSYVPVLVTTEKKENQEESASSTVHMVIQNREPYSVTKFEVIYNNVKSVLFRALVDPFMTGGWHVHYTQNEGPVGIKGIRRLAHFMGESYIDVPNAVGLRYAPQYFNHPVMPTITANVGFIFADYDYFGSLSVLYSMLFVLLLDFMIFLYRFLSDTLLAPFMAIISLAMLRLLQTDLTVVVVSHGLLLSMLLIFMMQGMIYSLHKKGRL